MPNPSSSAAASSSPSSSLSSRSGTADQLIHDGALTPKDVLAGTLSPRNPRKHSGTKKYEALVKHHAPNYEKGTRAVKTAMTSDLVKRIHADGGRFLSWNPTRKAPVQDVNGNPVAKWRVLSFNEARTKMAAAMKNENSNQRKRAQRVQLRAQLRAQRKHRPTPVTRDVTQDVHIPHFKELFKLQQDALKRRISDTDSLNRDTNFDVYCGRGCARAIPHPGNRLFIALVKANRYDYNDTVVSETKKLIVQSIYFAIKFAMGGRFLVRNKNQKWVEQNKDQTIRKIKQACRDAIKPQNRRQNANGEPSSHGDDHSQDLDVMPENTGGSCSHHPARRDEQLSIDHGQEQANNNNNNNDDDDDEYSSETPSLVDQPQGILLTVPGSHSESSPFFQDLPSGGNQKDRQHTIRSSVLPTPLSNEDFATVFSRSTITDSVIDFDSTSQHSSHETVSSLDDDDDTVTTDDIFDNLSFVPLRSWS